MEDNIDFVNPMFLWISSIESKFDEQKGFPDRHSFVYPSSPLMRAKHAVQRKFSGGTAAEIHQRRGTRLLL